MRKRKFFFLNKIRSSVRDEALLPLSVLTTSLGNRKHYQSVETYCMFIGYPRSGHSLVGALLNAHSEIVIAHELDALSYIERGISRNSLFSLILKRDRWFARSGFQWAGYSYQVPNQWQGKFRCLRVIGDKKGSASALRLRRTPELLTELLSTIGIPLRMIHVVRNPYDNITTMSLRNAQPIEEEIDNYFLRCDFIADLIARFPELEIITIQHEDLVTKPKEILKKLCTFLGMSCTEEYLNDCASIVFDSPSKTRQKVEWSDETISIVEARIAKIPFIHGYSFDS